jgi:hypothetical protein
LATVLTLSRYFRIPAAELRKRGVLNAHLGIDNRLFVDPNLLKQTKIPELKDARAALEKHFAPVITLLKASKRRGDAAWIEARKRLTFKEEDGAALGYGGAGSHGRAIGSNLADILVERAKEIIDLGIDAPEIFELIGLFQENFGADLLSDMAVSILKDRFLAYTQRVTKELNLNPSGTFPLNHNKWTLPIHPDGKVPLVFVPADILSPLPVALDPSEIWKVAAFNDRMRSQWNAIVAAAGKRKRDITKTEIRKMLFSSPQNLKDLIEAYRNTPGKKYDFDKDPDGILSWEFLGRTAAEQAPLVIEVRQPKSMDELRSVVRLIVAQFKKNVEENKLYEVLYADDGKPRREVFSQRLFFATADTYCEANDVDLSREPNAGSGPVDFKLSTGYKGRILVEVKRSDNPHLTHGFETQLPTYEKSESTEESVYLIMRVADGDSGINNVLNLRQERIKEGRKVPEVVVIDARKRRSASKRRRG